MLAVGLLPLFLTGCTRSPSVEAMELLNYNQCVGLEAGLTPIEYRALAEVRGGQLLTPAAPAAEVGQSVVLIALSRGPQPTPGYGFTLGPVTRTGHLAQIRVTWHEPAPGIMATQVATHPCLVVALPRAGLERVEAFDQTDRLIGSAEIPSLSR